MKNLTENNIKRATLSFLKSYYRYRPRAGDTQTSLDMRGDGGIIADGYLSFQQEDGYSFLATFEATSYNTKKEVTYTIEKKLLNWDSVTFSLFFTACFFTYTYIKDLYTVKEIGLWANFGLILVLSTILFFFYRIFFSPWHRYRYIYAVEQFKRYHANEQWIAIGEDVFANANDPYLMELRFQCVYNGFGLIIVDEQLTPHLNITPARTAVFKKQRQTIQFFNLDELTERMNKTGYTNFGDKAKAFFSFITNRGGGGRTNLNRFRKAHFRQMALTAFSLLLISGIFYKEIQDPEIIYVNEDAYQQRMIQSLENKPREAPGYLLDSTAFRPYDKKAVPYLEFEKALARNQEKEGEKSPDIVVYDRNNRRLTYDCERFYNFEKKLYLIEHSLHSSVEDATSEIRTLSDLGMDANTFWLGCFEADEDDYIVYLNLLYNSKWEAQADARDFEAFLENKNRPAELSIRSIVRPKDEE